MSTQNRKNVKKSGQKSSAEKRRTLRKILWAAGFVCGTFALPMFCSSLTAQENSVYRVGTVAEWNQLEGKKVKNNTVQIANDIAGSLGSLTFEPSVSFALTADGPKTLDFQRNAQAITMNAKIASSHTLTISGGNITIKNAVANDYFDYKGGAVYTYGTLTLDNTNYTFTDNFAGDTFHIIIRTYDGGALYATGSINLSGSNIFTNNSVSGTRCSSFGGAVSAAANMTLAGTEIFTGNSTSGSTAKGGAVHVGKHLNGTGTVQFSNNTARGVHTTGSVDDAYGGAIYAGGGMTFDGTAEFSGNRAQGGTSGAWGGALAVEESSLSLNGNYRFVNNTSVSGNTHGADAARGGAISARSGMTLAGTGVFSGNTVKNGCEVYGGAIYVQGSSNISGNHTFTNNSITAAKSGGLLQNQYACGGAIYNDGALNISGTSVFTGNAVNSYHAAYGGAIYSCRHNLAFSGNGSSAYFKNNTVNGSLNDIYVSEGYSINVQNHGKYYFGSGLTTTSWLGRHGNLGISDGAVVTFGSGSQSELAGGISLSGSTMRIELTEGNRFSGSDYSNASTATKISGSLSSDTASSVLFDIGLLNSGTYLVTKSNWTEATGNMNAVSDYYKSFNKTIDSTKDRTLLTISNPILWSVFRYDKNGTLAAGEDSLTAVLLKNNNLADGDKTVLSGNTSETGYTAIGSGVGLAIQSDTAGTIRVLDGTGNTAHGIIGYEQTGTSNTLTLSDLSFENVTTDRGVLSTAGTLSMILDNVQFRNNSRAVTGQGNDSRLALTGNGLFTGNTEGDLSARTIQLGDTTSDSRFSFGSGLAATTLDVVNTNAVLDNGSVTKVENMNLNGNADFTFLLNGANVVTDYSTIFADGATQLSASNVVSNGASNSLTFVVTGTYETANHEILAAVGDFTGVADLVSAQLASNATGIAYVKWIGENTQGEKGVWLGYENFETTSAVYRYQNGTKVDFGDTLLDASDDPVLAGGDSFVLTDNVEMGNYDGALELGDLSVSIRSNSDQTIRTIATPDGETAITFAGGNTLVFDDIQFDGGESQLAWTGTGIGETAGKLTVDFNNTQFVNAGTALSGNDLTLTGNATFSGNDVALDAAKVLLDGDFTFDSNTMDITGAEELSLKQGGTYKFDTGVQADVMNVYLDGDNALDSSAPGTVLTVDGSKVQGNGTAGIVKFLLTEASSELYVGTTSDWSGYHGTVYGMMDPAINLFGHVFVRSVDENGVMLRYDDGTSLVYRTVSEEDSTVIGGGNTIHEATLGVSSCVLADGNILTVFGNTQETEGTDLGTLSLTIRSDEAGAMRRIDGTGLKSVLTASGGNTLTLSDIEISGANVGISALCDTGKTGELTLTGSADFQNTTVDVIAQERLTLGQGTEASQFNFRGGLATDNLVIDNAAIQLGSDSVSQIDDSLSLANNASVTLNAIYDTKNRTVYASQVVAGAADYANDGTGTWIVKAPDADQIKTAMNVNMLISNDETLLDELHTAYNDEYHSLLYDIYIGQTAGAYGIYAAKGDPEKIAQNVGGNAPSDLILYGDDFLDVATVAAAQANAQRLSRESFAAAAAGHVFRLSQMNRMLTEQAVGETRDGSSEQTLMASSVMSSATIRGNSANSVCSAGCEREFWTTGYGSTADISSDRGFAGYDFRYGGFAVGAKWCGEDANLGLFYGYGQSRFSMWTSSLRSDDHTFGVQSKWSSWLGGGYTQTNGLFSCVGFHGQYQHGQYQGEAVERYGAFLGGVSLERGWKWLNGNGEWNPYGSLQYIGYEGDSFQQGDMTVGDQEYDSLRSRIGIRRTSTPCCFSGRGTFRIGVDYLHEFSDTQGCFSAGVGDVVAPIYSVGTGRDWLESSAGLTFQVNEQIELSGDYFALANRYVTQQAASGTLTVRY